MCIFMIIHVYFPVEYSAGALQGTEAHVGELEYEYIVMIIYAYF